jgi:AhpD family alkylhydroperoxidase
MQLGWRLAGRSAQPPEPVLPVGAVAADMGARQAAVREYDHRIVAVRGERDLDGRSAWRQRVAAGDTPAEHDAVRRLDGDVGAVPGAGARAIGDDLAGRGIKLSLGGQVYDPADPTGKDLPCCRCRATAKSPGQKGPLRPWNPWTSDRSNDMTDVTVINRRADSSANEDLTQLARHGADAFGYKAKLRIDRKLAQLLRLRVSQINNCTYCLNLHYEAARDAGIPRPVIDTLTAWWETDFHDAAARAALAYTEAITRVADATIADDFGARHDALAEHFSQEEILEIIGVVINMNVWTRLKLAEGASPGLAEQAMS